MFKKILLAYDGSEGAKKGLEVGLSLAKLHQAELWILAVQEKLPAAAMEVVVEKEFERRQGD